MTIVPPSGFLTEEPPLQDLIESKETSNRAHTYKRSKTAPSCTSEKEKTEKRQHREVVVSVEPDPSARTKKRKRGKKEMGLAERESRGRTSQVVMSGVKVKMSKRRLLLRKRYYSLKRLGRKK